MKIIFVTGAPGAGKSYIAGKKENKDMILEGIHLIPGLIDIDNGIDFIHIVLKVADEKRHMNQIKGQGINRASYKLNNFLKARAFQEFLLKQGQIYGAKIIENSFDK